VSQTAPPTEAAANDHRRLLDLAGRAQKGDTTALPALRELLKNPTAVDLLGGDMARQAQLSLIHKLSGKSLLLQESLPCKLDLMRAELAGPSPTPLERLLIESILTCWLHLYHLEIVFAQNDGMGLDLATYHQRSIGAAQKRYLAAIKALAAVRRLALPALRVNIARRQVNVAGPYVAPEADSKAYDRRTPASGETGSRRTGSALVDSSGGK
jgi:hypothetical protein